jgi:ADP-heptose:LPS heptosyltransferase
VHPRSLLLIQPRWLGDVLLCTPAIHAARAALPAARIDFATEPAGAAVLEGNPDLDDTIVATPGTGRLQLLRRLHRARYDAVVDFRSTGSTALMTAATGAPVRVGLRGRGFRNVAYNRLLPKEKDPVYMARQKLAMLAPIGIDVAGADTSLRIAIGEAERQRAGEIRERCGFSDDDVVVAISAVSRVQAKQWGTDRWAAVADRLARRGIRILLTSGPGERDQAAAVAERMTMHACWDYGPTTLRELAALYAHCSLWIGNDGGPKHIAAAAGTRTITVFRGRIGGVWTDAEHVALEPVGDGEVGVERVVEEVLVVLG